MIERFSEPYSATGGLAAEGVLNQLGRPDIEPLEVLVREAVQNCWDAKRLDRNGIRVEIGRWNLTREMADALRGEVLVNPPPGLALAEELATPELLYFADFNTDGLGGPTRADQIGSRRDFVDFVRNIGQPPDKDLGGGSFGYGKAAFYLASRAHTILIDTLCVGWDGEPERRFIGCALGENFDVDGQPFTGRHWWGRVSDGVPEPLLNEEAAEVAAKLGFPDRSGDDGRGTTVAVIAPSVRPEAEDDRDCTMEFIAEALVWNFWPRMIDTPGATKRTMEFRLSDDGQRVRVPDPRTHPRLRDFVLALDRLREEPGTDDDFILDRRVESFRPAQHLGRLVIQRGPVAPSDPPTRAVPQGARLTADSVHHVALMRNAELVVRYLPGAASTTGRQGYSGVFKCALGVDEAFRAAEPPTHDDWVYRALPKGNERTFVKVALERIAKVCREAAGYDTALQSAEEGTAVPLGEFADALAGLIPEAPGQGARRVVSTVPKGRAAAKRSTKGTTRETETVWVGPDAQTFVGETPPSEVAASAPTTNGGPRVPPPFIRSGAPELAVADDGAAVVRYPFDLRSNGNRVRLTAAVEVMANDGGQVEGEAPVGAVMPAVRAWLGPDGSTYTAPELSIGPDGIDGTWRAEVELADELMMRVDLGIAIP